MKLNIRKFKKTDAVEVSKLIIRNLLEINSQDYPLKSMESLAHHYEPEKIYNLAINRKLFVALNNETIIGTASLANFGTDEKPSYFASNVFVLPERHHQGIGKKLMQKIERTALANSCTKLSVPSGLTAEGFYLRMGYVYQSGVREVSSEGHILMEKYLD
jgi:GNAT superfamily N-acetyltransferase